MRRNDPRGGAGPNRKPPPTRQCPCRSSPPTGQDPRRLDSRWLSSLQPPSVETLHRLDHGRSHPQTHPHRSRSARDGIHHARSLTTVFGTEGRPGSLLQSRRPFALGLTHHLPLSCTGSTPRLQPSRNPVYSAHALATLTPDPIAGTSSTDPLRPRPSRATHRSAGPLLGHATR